MPGFFGLINHSCDIPAVDIHIEPYMPIISDEKKGQHFYFKRHVNPKFPEDKVFDEDTAVLIGTDGIIFNSRQLREKYETATNFALIRKIFTVNGIEGITELKGNFSGFIFDKKTGTLHIFTDHLNTKNLFYFYDETKRYLAFGSELKTVVSLMRSLGYVPTLSEKGAYCLLTFGYMIGDTTLVSEIKKVPPGTILTYSEEKVTLNRYYTFTTMPQITDSEETIIKNMDDLFSEAVRLEYEKDLEYGYSHAATLSGGLDSRMCVMQAKRWGFSDILCICFSQSDYLDEKIAKKIAADQGFDFIFHALDNGNFLKKIEEAVRVNDGLVLYAGAAHQQSTLKLLDWKRTGLLHTGLLWIPPWKGRNNHTPVDREVIHMMAFSKKLLDEQMIRYLVDPQQYENEEIFSLFERGSNGIFNGYRVTEQFTEFASPLHDRDFLAYALRIPPREGNYFYVKWFLSVMPEAAKYPRDKNNLRITAGKTRDFIAQVMRFLHRKWYGDDRGISMNPTEYWYKSNPALRSVIHTYYSANIDRLNSHTQLMKDARKLYSEGTFLEKIQVLTLLAAMKLHGL